MKVNKENLDLLLKMGEKLSRKRIAKILGTSDSEARDYKALLDNIDILSNVDEELIMENVKLSKQKQKFQDINRIERKSFRTNARLENAIEEYSKELIEVFGEHALTISTKRHKESVEQNVGVLQISDTHFNELVNLPENKFDFTIAAKRLQKFIYNAKRIFRAYGVNHVMVCLTGDLLNSDRRLDELLQMATNRSNATFLAVEVLVNAILDINEDFNVTCASVSGNESRVSGKEVGWVTQVATDTYDTTIHNILSYIFKDKEGVEVILHSPLEKVVEIKGKNLLLIHGHQFRGKLDSKLSDKIRQYAQKGIVIDFVIFGHLHEARIGDLYARSSSIVGANAYSENALGLTSKASQNVHIFTDTDIHSMKVDLQNYDGYEGYPIQKELESYNAKSADKCSTGVTVFKVVI